MVGHKTLGAPDIAMLRDLKEEEVEFEVEAMPEHLHPKGCFASGDEEMDRRMVQQILQDMKWNEWAWCSIRVTARWGEFSASDYLGGCSYASRKDFMTCPYFEDMKTEALKGLNGKLREAYVRLKQLSVLEQD